MASAVADAVAAAAAAPGWPEVLDTPELQEKVRDHVFS